MKITVLCAAAAVAALGLHTSALAGSPESDAAAEAYDAGAATAVTVRYGDLDLSRPAGVRILYHRLQDAALEACGASPFSVAPYRDAVRGSACYRQGLQDAVAATDLPTVTALLHGAARTTLAAN